jgi:hypothetical protein
MQVMEIIISSTLVLMLTIAFSCHAGRKASTYAPFQGNIDGVVDENEGGWPNDVVGPSSIKFSDSFPLPRQLTIDEIKGYIQSFVDAAKRALIAGKFCYRSDPWRVLMLTNQ